MIILLAFAKLLTTSLMNHPTLKAFSCKLLFPPGKWEIIRISFCLSDWIYWRELRHKFYWWPIYGRFTDFHFTHPAFFGKFNWFEITLLVSSREKCNSWPQTPAKDVNHKDALRRSHNSTLFLPPLSSSPVFCTSKCRCTV